MAHAIKARLGPRLGRESTARDMKSLFGGWIIAGWLERSHGQHFNVCSGTIATGFLRKLELLPSLWAIPLFLKRHCKRDLCDFTGEVKKQDHESE
jgi:hypothetical protein